VPIDSVQDLRNHIELAIQVELSTIPPYLFAMYSIENATSEAALLLRSIVAEEMLHAALASNLLLAVGGQPDFASTKYIPTYPSELPHHSPPLVLGLEPCSLELIQKVFMRIEQPETHGAPAQPDQFETLGQFYHALEIGLRELSARLELFADPQLDAQMSDPSFYRPVQFDAEDSGGLMMIEDLDSAIDAIEVIIHQGEGLSDERWADPAHQELTHYYKLERMVEGISTIGRVHPLLKNPRTAAYPRNLQAVSDLFNGAYRYLYFVLGELFSAEPGKGSHVGRLYRIMTGAMSPLARHLVTQPFDDRHAAPTFEILELDPVDPGAHLIRLADDAVSLNGELQTVAEAIEATVT
jgi:rubrerythrin